jgi:hypothetical protein
MCCCFGELHVLFTAGYAAVLESYMFCSQQDVLESYMFCSQQDVLESYMFCSLQDVLLFPLTSL